MIYIYIHIYIYIFGAKLNFNISHMVRLFLESTPATPIVMKPREESLILDCNPFGGNYINYINHWAKLMEIV